MSDWMKGERMKDSLAPGVALQKQFDVTDDMAPPHLPVKVLSTPSMVHLIEATCLDAASAHLDDNEVTVGTHICVSHHGAAMAGDEVKVECLLQTVEKRRLTFRVSVAGPNGTISEGTHERAVIDARRFG
jgi:fluoroacetyl-CoA thioesterase